MLRLVANVLLREVVVGSVLFAALGKDPKTNAALCLLIWTTLVLVSRRHGLSKNRTGGDLFFECGLVFAGALAFRNTLVILSKLLA